MNWKIVSVTVSASSLKGEISGCIQVKRRISSPLCDLRSINIILNECLRTLRNSGLWKDFVINPCVVSKWVLSIGKLFNTGAFTSPKILLSIKSVYTIIAWNRWISWTNGEVERLSSIFGVSFESMKPNMWCKSPLSKNIFKQASFW